MIGGYMFSREQVDLTERVQKVLDDTFEKISCGANGFLFFDQPYSDFPTAIHASENLTLVTQDLLVVDGGDGEYKLLDILEFSSVYTRKQLEVLQDIVSDFRLVLLERQQTETKLYLASNRAGNGRMYYHETDGGLLFASDIRFLLKILPFEAYQPSIYAMLKYGAVPEPLTVSKQIKAVPPAHYLDYTVNTSDSRLNVYFQFEFPCDARQEPVTDFDAVLQPVKATLRKSARFLRKQDPAILISGGIDSSLYAAYMHEFDNGRQLQGINCVFGDHDPEFEFAKALADRVNANLHVGKMEHEDALSLLQDTVNLTGHPFGDFSSLPIVFILTFMKERVYEANMLIEGNGADDCFGFPDLGTYSKTRLKQAFPRPAKNLLVSLFQHKEEWKWRSHEGGLARILALSDNHERNVLNSFLVFSPVNFLGLGAYSDWDQEITRVMDEVYARCGKEYDSMSYEAKTTIRQLLHINSRQWAAKAYSAGESLGIRVIYPYIWSDVLTVQGTVPWTAKIHEGVVKWPLKRLLEEFMPKECIYRQKSGFVPPFEQWLTVNAFNQTVRDVLFSSNGIIQQIVPPRILGELLDDALNGHRLRFPVLNFLWSALFTEMWIQKYAN